MNQTLISTHYIKPKFPRIECRRTLKHIKKGSSNSNQFFILNEKLMKNMNRFLFQYF